MMGGNLIIYILSHYLLLEKIIVTLKIIGGEQI